MFESKKKIRIGYILNDGWITPTPSHQRAIVETVDALERIGYSIKQLDWCKHEFGKKTVFYYLKNGASEGSFRGFIEALEGLQTHNTTQHNTNNMQNLCEFMCIFDV